MYSFLEIHLHDIFMTKILLTAKLSNSYVYEGGDNLSVHQVFWLHWMLLCYYAPRSGSFLFFPLAMHLEDWYVLHDNRSPGHKLEDKWVRNDETTAKVLKSSHCLHLVWFLIVSLPVWLSISMSLILHIFIQCWFLKHNYSEYCHSDYFQLFASAHWG